MKTVTWNLTLDDRPLELRVEHSRSRRELIVWVDGFPTRREKLPDHLHPRHLIELDLDGHAVAIVLVPDAHRLRYELAIDGRGHADGTPLAEIGLPVEGTTFLPGQLTFDADRYYSLFPRWPRVCTVTSLTGAALTVAATAVGTADGHLTDPTRAMLMFGISALITGVSWWWSDLSRHRQLLSWGAVRPALVVSTQPVRLAVSVDLAVNDGDCAPAVFVVEQPLDRVRSEVQVGDRAIVMAWYEHTQDGRRWHGVRLLAAECGSADAATIERIQSQVLDGEWRRLAQWHEAVGSPSAAGRWELSREAARTARTSAPLP
jgi:hypothetical protein